MEGEVASEPEVTLRPLRDHERAEAAELLYAALGDKLRSLFGPPPAGVRLLQESFLPGQLQVAVREGCILGVLAWDTAEAQFVDLGFRDVRRNHGLWRSIRLLLALGIFHQKHDADACYISAVAVASKARGMGIGQQLLAEAESLARSQSKGRLCLDVIETNSRARELYERQGYRVTKQVALGLLRNWMRWGFRSIYRMEKPLD